jgi:hypothetical protein
VIDYFLKSHLEVIIYALLGPEIHSIEKRLMFAPSKLYQLLILLAICIATGCTQERSRVRRGVLNQELYVGIGTEPAALDPHLTTGLTEFNVMVALLEGLTTIVLPNRGTFWAMEKFIHFIWTRMHAGQMAIR